VNIIFVIRIQIDSYFRDFGSDSPVVSSARIVKIHVPTARIFFDTPPQSPPLTDLPMFLFAAKKTFLLLAGHRVASMKD